MKKILRIPLLFVALFLFSVPISAHDFEVDGIYYNITNKTNKTVAVTYRGSNSYDYSDEYSGAVTIPSKVTYNNTTYSVTSIGNEAFYSCSGLKSATISNYSVTSIGSSAFEGCTSLTSVTIPYVTSIGSSAFKCCTNLTSVTIPYVIEIGDEAFSDCTGLTSATIGTFITIGNPVTKIGYGAFSYCDELASVTLGKYVTEIGSSAFMCCTSLTEITIPNFVTKIGKYAFYDCSGLTKVNISDLSAWCKIDFVGINANPLSYGAKLILNGNETTNLVFPNDISEIKKYAFEGCSSLTSITIPNSVTEIGEGAFFCCTSLTSVAIGNSATKIGYGAFKHCSSLTSITIPNSATEIGDRSFEGCTGLTSVTIPNSVTSIGNWAFKDCTGLTSVTIPNSVTSIGLQSFSGCSLDFVTSYRTTPPLCYIEAFDGSYSALLKVPNGTKDAYANATEWNKFTNIQEIASVETVKTDNDNIEIARYDINSRLLNEPTKGINIVKFSNGTKRKEIVK